MYRCFLIACPAPLSYQVRCNDGATSLASCRESPRAFSFMGAGLVPPLVGSQHQVGHLGNRW
jgi:hypothetical protein